MTPRYDVSLTLQIMGAKPFRFGTQSIPRLRVVWFGPLTLSIVNTRRKHT